MIGAIAGDIIGSVYEFYNVKTTDFKLFPPKARFTDDTVLTVAVADCILNGKKYATTFQEYGHRYQNAGYGDKFGDWLDSESLTPYNSYGNGSAMRVSPVGFAFTNISSVLEEAKRSAEVTHDNAEGIKGAQAVAISIYLARTGSSKDTIRDYVEENFEYDLHRSLDEIRPDYTYDETCQGSVPEAIIAFLESNDYEDAVRKAVSLGGDSDTQACITGGIAQAYYKAIPKYIIKKVRAILDPELLKIVDQFAERYMLD